MHVCTLHFVCGPGLAIKFNAIGLTLMVRDWEFGIPSDGTAFFAHMKALS